MQGRSGRLARPDRASGLPPFRGLKANHAGKWIAQLRHALYGKRSEQLNPDDRQPAFEDLEAAVAEAEAAREAVTVRNADGTTRRPAAKRNLGHLPDHPLPGNRMHAFDERGPRIEQVIEPAQKVCPCGCSDRVKIPSHGLQANQCRATGEDRAERLDIIPARFQVIRCPAAHVYRRARGHGSPPLCLPPLRCWRLSG